MVLHNLLPRFYVVKNVRKHGFSESVKRILFRVEIGVY